MKKRFAIVIDSFSNITKEKAKENNLFYIPLQIILDDISYNEGVDFSLEEFLIKINKSKSSKTSLPNLELLNDLIEEIKKDYDGAIFIPVSQKFSGTYNLLKNLVKDNKNFHVLDTCFVGKTGFYVAKTIREKMDSGLDIEEILEWVSEFNSKTINYIIPRKIATISKSGRASTLLKSFVNKLNLVFTIQFDENGIKIASINTFINKSIKKALNRIENFIQKREIENYEIDLISNGDFLALEETKEMFGKKNFKINEIYLSSAAAMINGGFTGITIVFREKI
ncbi:DegV family protein [[Mycoplasma] mobile]|uniref:DegV homolog n=1 Tax=Mycoplasma mobile (strain ATCC 43663 / 163K / NCTC 11711) TaxID=267748 RepID=Q6KIB1_MYCM1|nr:DegV family protein [[Mycoplasma] mobile]AAT27665.1 degV homolog [Mycoplasma mobile 163K]